METFLNIFWLIIIIVLFLPLLLGFFWIDIFWIENNKNRASIWYSSWFILPLLFLIFIGYNQSIENNNKVAKCLLNYNYYWYFTKNELINDYNKYCNNKDSNSDGCFRFIHNFSSSTSNIWYDMYNECLVPFEERGDNIFYIKPKIIDCIYRDKVLDEVKKLDLGWFINKNWIDNFYKFLDKIEEVEKSAKNCVYIYK